MERPCRRRRTGVLLLQIALLSTLSGCALLGARHGKNAPQRPEPISLEVDNQNFYDAVIYSLIGGQRARLGTVTGETKAHFKLPWTPQDVAMAIHLIGAGTTVTRSVTVYPGDKLLLILQPDMHRFTTGHP